MKVGDNQENGAEAGGNQETVPTPLTFEQVQQTVSNDPEMQKQLAQQLTQTPYGKEILNNHLNSTRAALEGELTGKGYKNALDLVDSTLKEFLGDLPDGANTTERLVAALKAQSKQDSSTAEQEVSKKANEELLRKYQELEQKLEETNQEKESLALNYSVESSLKEAVSGIDWKLDVDKDILFGEYGMITSAIKDLKANAKKQQDGSIVFYKNNEPVLNTEMKPATATEIIKQKFAKYVAPVPAAGGGAGKETASESVTLTSLSQAKSRGEALGLFAKNMAAAGHAKGSPEYNEAYVAMMKSEAYTKLPH